MSNELNNYKKNGFYIAKGLIKKSKVIKLNNSLAHTLAAQIKFIGGEINSMDLFSLLSELHMRDIQRYKKVLAALWRKTEVFEIMHSKEVINFLRNKFYWTETFLPGGQVVLVMAEELKIPNGYFGLIAHQDFPSVQGSIDGIVVWLPLTNVDKLNYPLEVIPGSHKKGLLKMINRGSSTWEVDPSTYNSDDFIPVEVELGDVVFISNFTIHRSSCNGTKGRVRIAVSTRFDNANEPSFIERAYPTAYLRTVHREQYVDDFPTIEHINKVFDIP